MVRVFIKLWRNRGQFVGRPEGPSFPMLIKEEGNSMGAVFLTPFWSRFRAVWKWGKWSNPDPLLAFAKRVRWDDAARPALSEHPGEIMGNLPVFPNGPHFGH